jgi:hypothetical protein
VKLYEIYNDMTWKFTIVTVIINQSEPFYKWDATQLFTRLLFMILDYHVKAHFHLNMQLAGVFVCVFMIYIYFRTVEIILAVVFLLISFSLCTKTVFTHT